MMRRGLCSLVTRITCAVLLLPELSGAAPRERDFGGIEDGGQVEPDGIVHGDARNIVTGRLLRDSTNDLLDVQGAYDDAMLREELWRAVDFRGYDEQDLVDYFAANRKVSGPEWQGTPEYLDSITQKSMTFHQRIYCSAMGLKSISVDNYHESDRDVQWEKPPATRLIVYGGTNDKPMHALSSVAVYHLDESVPCWRYYDFNDTVGWPQGRAGHSAVVWKNKMTVFGGYGFSKTSSQYVSFNDVYILNLDTFRWTTPSWSTTNPHRMFSPQSLDSHSEVVTEDGMMVIYGGRGQTDILQTSVYTMDLETYEWKLRYCTGLPYARHSHTAVLYEHQMVVHGGVDGQPGPDYSLCCASLDCNADIKPVCWSPSYSSVTSVLNLTTWHWNHVQTTGVDHPPPMAKHSAVVNDDAVIFYGGYGYHNDYIYTAYNEVYKLDLKDFSWSRVHTYNKPLIGRYDHEAVVSDGHMYIFGGKSLSDEEFPNADCHGTTENQGRRIKDVGFGDGINHVCFHNDLWALNMKTWVWREVHEGPSFDDGSLTRKRFSMIKYTPTYSRGRDADTAYLKNALWAETIHRPTQMLLYYQHYMRKMGHLMHRVDNGIPALASYIKYVARMEKVAETYLPEYEPEGPFRHITVPILFTVGSLLTILWLHLNIHHRNIVARKQRLYPMCLWGEADALYVKISPTEIPLESGLVRNPSGAEPKDILQSSPNTKQRRGSREKAHEGPEVDRENTLGYGSFAAERQPEIRDPRLETRDPRPDKQVVIVRDLYANQKEQAQAQEVRLSTEEALRQEDLEEDHMLHSAAPWLKLYVGYIPGLMPIALSLLCLFTLTSTGLAQEWSEINGKLLYSPAAVVCVTEFTKLLINIPCLLSQMRNLDSLEEREGLLGFQKSAFLWYLIPASLFATKNILSYIVVESLGAGLARMLGQLKILFTGVIYDMLARMNIGGANFKTLKEVEWLALLVLLFASTLASGAGLGGGSETVGGFIAAVAMGLFATLGNLSNEVIVKHKTAESQGAKQSIFAQNIMLYAYSTVIALGFWIHRTRMEESFFHGWDYKTFIIIGLQVSSGSTISFVLKYLNNITYTVINTLSIVVTAVVAAMLFGDNLTFDFTMAGFFIVLSAYMMYRGRYVGR